MLQPLSEGDQCFLKSLIGQVDQMLSKPAVLVKTIGGITYRCPAHWLWLPTMSAEAMANENAQQAYFLATHRFHYN